MSTKILKTSMLALAGAVALGAAGSVSAAIPPPYLLCDYKGQTQLAPPGGGAAYQCWLNLSVKVGCDTDTDTFYVVAAGANPGDAACSDLFLGNFPWTGSLANIMPGPGVINTLGGPLPWSVIDGNGPGPAAGGNVSGVTGINPQMHTCNGVPITVPHNVVVAGAGNFGPMLGTFSTLNTVAPNHLEKKGCHVVL